MSNFDPFNTDQPTPPDGNLFGSDSGGAWSSVQSRRFDESPLQAESATGADLFGAPEEPERGARLDDMSVDDDFATGLAPTWATAEGRRYPAGERAAHESHVPPEDGLRGRLARRPATGAGVGRQ